MSFDLLFIAYEQTPPSAAVAQEISLSEDDVPKPQFATKRAAVVEKLIEAFPQYAYSPSSNGEDLGGLLACENCDLPDINFGPSHAMVEAGFVSDPVGAQKTLVNIARVFEKHRFAIYDPENEKLWRAAELEAWLPSAIQEEQQVRKEIQEGRVEFKERPIHEKKPWWRLW